MRELLVLGYGFLTAILCGKAMLSTSFRIGAVALAAAVLNFAGLALFFAFFLARRDKGSGKMKLIGAGALALVLAGAGFALMIWSGFWISVYDVAIPGPAWLIVGFAAAFLWAADRRAKRRW